MTLDSAMYITPDAKKTGKNSKFCDTMVWLRPVSSAAPTADASDVDFSSPTVSLPSVGMRERRACGSTMRNNSVVGGMPRARAASRWWRSVASMPPRRISAQKAVSLMVRAISREFRVEKRKPIAGNVS